MLGKCLIAAGTSVVLLVAQAGAAVITIQTSAHVSGAGEQFDPDIKTNTYDTVGASGNASQVSNQVSPLESATGFGSADALTGVLKAKAETFAPTAVAGMPFTPFASGYGFVLVEEIYTVSGDGTVTVEMAYDGIWSVSEQEFDNTPVGGTTGTFGIGWQAQGRLSVFGTRVSGATDTFQIQSPSTPKTGSIEGLLTVSAAVKDGDEITVTSSLLAQILSGTNGYVDFSRTAFLSVMFSGGATGAPNDPRFLSTDPFVDPSVIPIPVPALLLLSGIAALAGLRRRRL
jgi:hypothetical protein